MAFQLLYVAAEMLTVCWQSLLDDSLNALGLHRCLISGGLGDGIPLVKTRVWYGAHSMSENKHSGLFHIQEE